MASWHDFAVCTGQRDPLAPGPVVAEVGWVLGGEDVEGLWIPSTWFDAPALQFPNGKPNLKAIVLLADLLHWYTPAGIYDAETGARTGWRQRFDGDKLQKNLDAWGREFGFTRRETQLACHFLRDAGLITIELRNIIGPGGRQVSNVNFFEPVVRKLARLADPTLPDRAPSYIATDTLAHPDVYDSYIEMSEGSESCDLEIVAETNLPAAQEENPKDMPVSPITSHPAELGPAGPETPAPEPSWRARERLCDAVLLATNNTRRFEHSTVAIEVLNDLAAVLDYLEACGRGPADVELYSRSLPAFQKKSPERTCAPSLRQMLNNFERVVEWAAKRAHAQTAASGPAQIAREYRLTAEPCEGNTGPRLEIVESGREMTAAPR